MPDFVKKSTTKRGLQLTPWITPVGDDLCYICHYTMYNMAQQCGRVLSGQRLAERRCSMTSEHLPTRGRVPGFVVSFFLEVAVVV